METERVPHSVRRWGLVVLLGLVTACAVVVAHELGHHMPAVLFNFHNPTLHYGSATFTEEEAILQLARAQRWAEVEAYHPRWQLALNAGGGPLVSLLITAACALLAWKRYHPIWVIAGIQSTAVRAFTSIMQLALDLMCQRYPGSDESAVALLTGVSIVTVSVAQLVLLLGLYVVLISRIPRGQRLGTWVSLIFCTVAGWILWFDILGPKVLP